MVIVQRHRGFTLIELLVVLAIIGTLLSIAAPRYTGTTERAKEAVLRENLATLRDAIDKHYSDTGAYPLALSELVKQRYLRRVPLDPITVSEITWVVVPPPEGKRGAIFDVRSGSLDKARDGTRFNTW